MYNRFKYHLALFFFRIFSSGYFRKNLVDDVLEEYYHIKSAEGDDKAVNRLLFESLRSIPFSIKHIIFRGSTMVKNYMKIAFRNILRYKGYSAINIIGLSIGMVTCVFILLFIQNELSYDTFHSKAGNIYRIATNIKVENTERSIASTFGLLAPLCKEEIPEIVSCTRMIRPNRNTKNKVKVMHKDNYYYLDYMHHVDPNFFEFFDFELKYGAKKDVLKYPGSVVVTRGNSTKDIWRI